MNKYSTLLFVMIFSFLFGDANVQIRLENGQKAHGEFIGIYMNHVHMLIGEKIIYYSCDEITSITNASEGLSSGRGFDYDCSINTVTADILFPPELDPMTGEMAQILPDVFNPDIPKHVAKVEVGVLSTEQDFVVIDGVKYARVAPEKETAQVDPKAAVSVRAILPGQKSAIKSLSTAAGFTNADLNTFLIQNYTQPLDGLSHAQASNVINKFQAGSVSKPAQTRNNQTTYNNAGSATKLNACQQAKIDAVKLTSPLWYGGGLMYPIGVPAFLLIKPQPNVLAFSKIPNEEQLLYIECYKSAEQNERVKRMALGCGGYMFVFFVLMGNM